MTQVKLRVKVRTTHNALNNFYFHASANVKNRSLKKLPFGINSQTQENHKILFEKTQKLLLKNIQRGHQTSHLTVNLKKKIKNKTTGLVK